MTAPVTIQQPLVSFRFADTLYGDDLQTIAYRVLGDASKWTLLASLNNLLPPFITDDPTQASESVLLSGQPIMVPASAATVPLASAEDASQVFGSDLALDENGFLFPADGDFAIVSGRPNLHQAISNALRTDPGELIFHPSYGCKARRLIGAGAGPSTAILAAGYVRTTLLADPRISEVTSCVATVVGTQIQVQGEVVPVAGNSLDFSTVI